MAFWAGVAQGFRDSEARKERDMARQERQEERDYNRGWQERMFDYRQKQDEYARSRQMRLDEVAMEDRAYNRKMQEEALKLNRLETFLPYLNNPALAGALAGTGSSSDLAPMQPEAIAAGSNAFKMLFKELTPEQQKDPFFVNLSQSAEGQASVMAFMAAQADGPNNITLADMPKYFKYLGATKGAGQEEAKEFLSSVFSGDANINDTDTFIKGLLTLQQYKPVQHMFIQTSSPASETDVNSQYENWKVAVLNEARHAAHRMPKGREKDSILSSVKASTVAETESEGLRELTSQGFGSSLLKSQGFGDNYLIATFYDSQVEAPEVSEKPSDDVTETVDLSDEPTFNSYEEALQSLPEGFSGYVVIAGRRGMVNLPKPAGEDFVEFGDSATETIQEGVDTINQSSTDVYYGELAETVKSELMDAGIVWPTNEQELNHFIDDVNEAVESFGLNIPQEVLDMVMDQASQNALN